MPPRPFPYPLRVGVDLCHAPRIKRIIARPVRNGDPETRPLAQFLSKFLTWPERQYFFERFGNQSYANIDKTAEFLAGRWAAKEACRKACTHLGLSNGMHSIMILPVISRRSVEHVLPLTSRPQGLILRKPLPSRPTESKSYSPEADPSTGSKSYLFDLNDVEGQMCEISISHDGGWAQAVAMVPDTNWMRDIADTVPSSDTAMADMKRE